MPLSVAPAAIDTSNYAALGIPNLSAAATAAANPSLLGLGPTASALQLRLASAAGGVQTDSHNDEPNDKSETRRQRRCVRCLLILKGSCHTPMRTL